MVACWSTYWSCSSHCAHHAWFFQGYSLEDLIVSSIRRILSRQDPPSLPVSRLGVERDPPESMWSRDIKMWKHLLPVYDDLLYRLQHNSLYLGYRLQTPQHVSSWVWPLGNGLAPILVTLLTTSIEWESVLWFKVDPTSVAKNRYGFRLFLLLHIVWLVVFRCIWMHRNDIRFHDLHANNLDVQARIKSYVFLHIEWYHQNLVEKSLSHSGIQCFQQDELLQSFP
ncbi:hypothetical protein PsorP6_011253 [Peronosclerospora sorghi]|uniref:Uncharacterized protein n=1 Tax=Peronosclerospora sorghi TaxID=230839 RepID=A0ACC0WKP9_9STRA|nr:hypothetical protein PsorP6_011253 [Peronosclerospora sorghi]